MASRRSPRRPLLLLAAAGGLLAAAASAQADEPVGASARGTAIVADAGYAAWRADDGRVVVRIGDRAPQTTGLRPPAGAILDLGRRRGGGPGAQLVYAQGCSTRTRTCAVRSATLTSAGLASGSPAARVVARIAYRGGGPPALAVDGARLAYAVHGTTGSGRSRADCDVPYVRTLTARGGPARRLDRGHCAALAQLDLEDGTVAVLAHPGVRVGSGATEARVVRYAGGPSRTLQREAQGEESNYIGAVSLDRGNLYTSRGGIRQANVFTRFPLARRSRADARAFVNLEGAFARDRDRSYYLQTVSFESSTECGAAAGAPGCLVVAGSDPFTSAQRQLAPQLALTVSPQPVFTDSAPAGVATLTRRTVTRTAVVATTPVAGVPVELLAVTPTSATANPGPPTPTGATATTGADGTATIPIPGGPVPRRFLAAVTRPGAGGVAIPTTQTTFLQTYVRLTATAQRLADGRLQVSGTISPAQPGRTARLDRRLERSCGQLVVLGTLISPSQVGVPAGCVDRYTQDPVTTARVSADGTSYTLVAPATAPAGTYRVALDFAGGAPVYAGETAPLDAP